MPLELRTNVMKEIHQQ